MSIHTASRLYTRLAVRLVGLGLGLASQASRMYLAWMAIHTAMGEASRMYSISLPYRSGCKRAMLLVFWHTNSVWYRVLSDPRHHLPPTQNWLTQQRGFSATAALLVTVDTPRCAVTLNCDPVTLTFDIWPWTFVVCWLCRSQTLYEIEQSGNLQPSYCSLKFDLMTLNVYHVLRYALG